MFWKLVLMAAIVFFFVGKTPALHNPLVRLFLPRSWAMALSMLPDRRAAPRSRGPRPAATVEPEAEAPAATAVRRPWLEGRAWMIFYALVLIGLVVWLATRTMISMETGGAPTPLEP